MRYMFQTDIPGTALVGRTIDLDPGIRTLTSGGAKFGASIYEANRGICATAHPLGLCLGTLILVCGSNFPNQVARTISVL